MEAVAYTCLVLGKRGIRDMRSAKWMLATMCFAASAMAGGQAGPVHLQVDNLDRPLGIDDPMPRFSWQVNDAATGREADSVSRDGGDTA